jgi:hypothetical protein
MRTTTSARTSSTASSTSMRRSKCVLRRLGGRRGWSPIRTHLRPWRSRRLILCVRCTAGVSRGRQLGSGATDV